MLIDKSNDKTRALFALSTAAMSLGLGPKQAFAAIEEGTTVSLQVSTYNEDDVPSEDLLSGSEERYDIETGLFRIRSTVSEDTEIIFGLAAETLSGASPWWVQPGQLEEGQAADSEVDPVQVMSGATIDEERVETDLTLRKHWGETNFGLHFGYSNENDYTSSSFGISAATSFNQKATTIEVALSGSQDYIEPTDAEAFNRVEREDKNVKNGSVGITQIINKNALVSSTISFSRFKGFLSDPYKLAFVVNVPENTSQVIADSRPDSKSQFAWSVAGRYFVEEANAAVHADYRFYTNDWGITSNTVEFGWHQNLFQNVLILAPQVRVYVQSEAEFYQPYYQNLRTDGFHSSDYRLSDYTAVSGALQATLRFEKFNINANFERYVSSGDNPGLVDFNFASIGFDLHF